MLTRNLFNGSVNRIALKTRFEIYNYQLYINQ